MKSIFVYIYTFIYLFISLIFILHIKILKLLKMDDKATLYAHKKAKNWARITTKLAGGKIIVTGLENLPKDETMVFVANHQGYFDILLLLGYIDVPKGFVGKIELLKVPLISTWMKNINCVFIDRNDIRQSLQTILKAIDYVNSGHSMVIFPEGTRSKGNPIGEFKKGSLKIATKTNVPIVPISIDGTYKIHEKRKRVFQKSDIYLNIGEPIYLDELDKNTKKDLNNYVKNRIQNLYNKTRGA